MVEPKWGGLYTKVAQIVAHEFQIDAALVKITATTTGKVPNTSATAASSGTDLNGMAAMRAARTIKDRIAAFLADEYQTDQANVVFANGQVHVEADAMTFAEAVKRAAHRAGVTISNRLLCHTKIELGQRPNVWPPFFIILPMVRRCQR